jgi:hypothetical protein
VISISCEVSECLKGDEAMVIGEQGSELAAGHLARYSIRPTSKQSVRPGAVASSASGLIVP